MLFVTDHRFYRAESGGVFTRGGQFPYVLWQRYFDAFSSVTVIGRERELQAHESRDQMQLSSGAQVQFCLLPSLSSLRAQVGVGRQVRSRLWQEIQAVDCVLVRLPSELGLLALGLAEMQKKVGAVELGGCVWDALWNHGSIHAKAYAPLAYLRLRRAVGCASRVLYVTEEFLQQRYPTTGDALGCTGVKLHLPAPEVVKKRMEKIDHHESPLRFGLIGSLSQRYKGVDVALRALAAAISRLPPAKLCILGAGDPAPFTEQAESLGLAQRVEFAGVLPAGAAVWQWLDQVDVYLQPSRQEGLPRGLMEAMSRACPALGSTAGGIPELLESSCLHAPGNHRHLSKQLIAAADAGWQKTQAERNYNLVMKYEPRRVESVRRAFLASLADEARGAKGR